MAQFTGGLGRRQRCVCFWTPNFMFSVLEITSMKNYKYQDYDLKKTPKTVEEAIMAVLPGKVNDLSG